MRNYITKGAVLVAVLYSIIVSIIVIVKSATCDFISFADVRGEYVMIATAIAITEIANRNFRGMCANKLEIFGMNLYRALPIFAASVLTFVWLIPPTFMWPWMPKIL
jgi:hypothetical protein